MPKNILIFLNTILFVSLISITAKTDQNLEKQSENSVFCKNTKRRTLRHDLYKVPSRWWHCTRI